MLRQHQIDDLMPLIKKVAETHVLSEALLNDYAKHVVSLKPGSTENEIIKRVKEDFEQKIDEFIKELSDKLNPPPTIL
ncbi:MAG: hypothetical protein U0T32_12155 [Chitinophagales bacterium]